MPNNSFIKHLVIIAAITSLSACGGGESGGDGSSQSSNNAPVLANIATQYTNKNTNKAITLSATDANKDDITFKASTQDANTSLSMTGNKLTVTPSLDWVGSSAITITVSDGTLRDTSSFTFIVLDVSKPPTLTVSDSSIPTPPPIPTF